MRQGYTTLAGILALIISELKYSNTNIPIRILLYDTWNLANASNETHDLGVYAYFIKLSYNQLVAFSCCRESQFQQLFKCQQITRVSIWR